MSMRKHFIELEFFGHVDVRDVCYVSKVHGYHPSDSSPLMCKAKRGKKSGKLKGEKCVCRPEHPKEYYFSVRFYNSYEQTSDYSSDKSRVEQAREYLVHQIRLECEEDLEERKDKKKCCCK